MSKKRLSHDQKRKAKLAEKAKRSRQNEPLAYEGRKYKTDELIPVFYRTELGIYEAYVQSDQAITDRTVEAALGKLIQQMRDGTLPPLEEARALNYVAGQEEELIIANVRRNWQLLFDTQPHPGRDKLIGVLRTTLNSIKTWSSPSPESRGYIHYIKGFLAKAGAALEEDRPEFAPDPDEDEEVELLIVGRAWCLEGDAGAGDEFQELAESMIRAGQAEAVVEICHRLMAEVNGGPTIPVLSKLSILAQQKLKSGAR
jgi:hypothetical protein